MISQSENAKTKAKLKGHKALIKKLTGRKIEAGWFESAMHKGAKGPIPTFKIARWQEFGTATIPARPFMRLAAENFSRNRSSIQQKITKKLLNGKITPDQALSQIGGAMEGEIVNSIKNGKWEPNAKSTARAKGFNRPLIDKGEMWQQVTSKVT